MFTVLATLKKFKDEIIKNFKTADKKHETPGMGLLLHQALSLRTWLCVSGLLALPKFTKASLLEGLLTKEGTQS